MQGYWGPCWALLLFLLKLIVLHLFIHLKKECNHIVMSILFFNELAGEYGEKNKVVGALFHLSSQCVCVCV